MLAVTAKFKSTRLLREVGKRVRGKGERAIEEGRRQTAEGSPNENKLAHLEFSLYPLPLTLSPIKMYPFDHKSAKSN